MTQFEGTLIAGRYDIREHIATGGMASVFKTWDHRVERMVAIKVLRSLDQNDLRAVERVRREARAGAALAHAQETLEIAAQVCSVLQVAHARGFIHRDIKPQNIMLVSSAAPVEVGDIAPAANLLVKLTDFGIVRVAEDAGLTNSGIVLGTADYLSPEQARGEKLTASSDLYSLGVVMFEMLTGRPPFVGPTAVSIAMQHASTYPPPVHKFNANVPPALEQIVNRVLEKEPEDRFLSASDMERALRQCARELSDRGKPAPSQAASHQPPAGPGAPGQFYPPVYRQQF
ncbi:MAG: hypothetical protein NVS3B14_18720 [Ktedonobacteraceae bacterium]